MNTLVEERLIGIPYKLGRCDYDGADCIGTAILWYRSHGVNFEYNDGKGPISYDWFSKSPRRMLDAILQFGDVIHFHELKKYDLFLIYSNEGLNVPTGLAVMVDGRHILTSREDTGSFMEMLNISWKEKFYGAIRPHKIKHLQEN